MQLVLDC